MDLPATQAMDDEDFVPTQKVTDNKEREKSLIGTLIINDNLQHQIFSGITIIGRLPGCAILLNDETVSKRHAEIEAESTNRAIFIKDLGSSNKTKINDTKLRSNASYQIRDNDKLNFGKVAATFKIHQPVEDSFVACTPQVNRKAIIPDTPDSSMDNSSALEGDVSAIPETQGDEDDSCFRRPQIPVRTSISNEHQSPKHVPFTLDDVPSPLANNKDENDISGVETQRFTVDNTKEMTDNSIYTVETQKFEKSNMQSRNNEDCGRILNNSSVKKVLSEEFKNQSLEDVETQEFVQTKSHSNFRRSQNTSIYSAKTQEALPSAHEDQSIENAETQPFIPTKSGVDEVADVSIHSAPTQKNETIVREKKPIEDLETQPFTRDSFSSDKRKSANVSIYSAETQKIFADVSNQSLDNIETQKFNISNSDLKTKSADVSIYSAATQKIISENGDIENLETQKFDSARVSASGGSHQIVKEDQMASSLSFSLQDIDTMPFTKHELSLDRKSNVEVQNENVDLLDSAASPTKSGNEKEIEDSKSSEQIPTSEQSDEPHTVDVINEDNLQKQNNETHSKSMTKSLHQSSNKFDKSKSLVESDDEEEIFSQNLIENCPFHLHLDDSKNDVNEQSIADLQNHKEVEIDKIVDSEQKISSDKVDISINNEKLVKNNSNVAGNDDSETDEEGVFSSNSFKENENKKLPKETENDSETDEEGVFSNHLTEEENKSNNKPGGDSETDEEGVFSGLSSKDSKERSSDNNNRIIDESASEDEGVFSNDQSKSKQTKVSVDSDKNTTKTTADSSLVNKSTKTVITPAPEMELSLNKVNEIVQADSPIPESDDDIFNENDEEKRTSFSSSDKVNGSTIDKDNIDPIEHSSKSDAELSGLDKNDNDNKDVDELAPTQIVGTGDLSLEPTQIINTNEMSNWGENKSEEIDELAPTQLIETEDLQNQKSNPEEKRSNEVDELAPTQLIETQNLQNEVNDLEEERSNEVDELAPTQLIETQNLQNEVPDLEEERSDEVDELAPTQLIETQNLLHDNATVTDSVRKVKEYDGIDVVPTQKLDETQDCAESLAPTQKVVDTQIYSEEMEALQFSESLAPTQIVESEPNDVDEITASPKKSPNTSKRQLEEVEITSNKKLKMSEDSPKVNVDLNGTIEKNLNEMFEGSEEKAVNIEDPIETQQLENILESSQTEESTVALDVSVNKPSPTLSSRRSNMRSKNRRRTLMLNKSGALNETPKSIANLNDTIEQNLNELFDNSVDNTETFEPEPMLTQQLENILVSSQDNSPVDSKKEEEGRTLNVSRKKSLLSLSSMGLNNSIAKIQNDKEKCLSKNVQSNSKDTETTSSGSLNEKTQQKEDYSANLEKDNGIREIITSGNDKAIVYRRGTIGFTNSLEPVSTFDRVPFLDKYSTSDSYSDGDDIFKLRQSPSTPKGKKRVSLRLKRVNLNSSLTSSASDQDVEKSQNRSPVLSSKKVTPAHHRSAKKRNPVVRLSKLSSPLYRKHVKPVKRVRACGTIGFTDSLQPVECEELVSAASTESEDDLKVKVGTVSTMIDNLVHAKGEHLPANSRMKDDKNDLNSEPLSTDSLLEDDKNNDSGEDFPAVEIAGTAKNPVTSSQIAALSDEETDNEPINTINIQLPDRWKWYSEKRFDDIYEKCNISKKKTDDSGSENDDNKEMNKNSLTDDSVKDSMEDRRAAIDKLLAEVALGKDEKRSNSNRGVQNNCRNAITVTTRSRKLRKSKTPSPKPPEDYDTDCDKTNPVESSSSDSESSQSLSILPKYKPVAKLKINTAMLSKKPEDEDDDYEKEFEAPRICETFNRMKPKISPKASPLNARRGRKSACNNNVKGVTQCENNADNKKLGTPIIGIVDKDGLVFQVSRNSKVTSTRTPATATNRTKRIIDGDEDDESTHQPSPKRTKTLANHQKLQHATVVISPLADKLKKLREANRLNIANELSNFKQPESTLPKKRTTRAPKTLDSYVVTKTLRTDSSDLSAVESSIVEDKNDSKNKSKIKNKPAAVRNRKAKVDTSSEQSANSSKENLEESDVQKPKTRGRGRRIEAVDSSGSDKESSKDEIPASDVESKSTRSTRGRLVRQNQTKTEEENPTIKYNKSIEDSDLEVSQKSKNSVRKNTRNQSAKNADKSSSSKIDDVADSKHDKIQDKRDTESESSQSESVTARTTRTRKNKVNQESDSGSLETCEVTATSGSRRKLTNNKSGLIIKLTDIDSNKETMIKSDETNDEVNVFKLMKKKMNVSQEEPTAAPAKKTRSRAAKNTFIVEETSSEESQEVSDIMKNRVLEDSKVTTRRRGRAVKTNSSYVENTESSDDVFEKPTSRPKRARLTKADKNKSSHVSDTDDDSTKSSQKSTRRKHSPSPSPTLPSDAALTLTPSRLSRLSLSPTKRPKVLFTGEKSETHRQILKNLGGVETEEINSCSVLITDKVRRTFKFLCSLARGIPIASVKWLDESKKANHLLDLEEYILNDPEAEAKFKFNLKESLNKARQNKLLEGYTIVLSSKIKQPPISELKEMVVSSGGKPLVRAPAKWSVKSIVVTTEEELDSAKKLIAKAPKSVTVQSVEFILTGILRQDTNLNEFKLLG